MVKYEEVIKNEDIFSIIIHTIDDKKNLIDLLKTSKNFKKSINIYYPNNNKLKNNLFEIPKKSCIYKITDELINLDIIIPFYFNHKIFNQIIVHNVIIFFTHFCLSLS